MGCVSHDASHAFLPYIIWFMDPQAPRAHFVAYLEVPENLTIEVWIWCKEFLDGSMGIPCLVLKISCLSREEAVE